MWRGKNGGTRRKTLGARTRTKNKLDTHMTRGPGIEPGWEVSALTTAPNLLPNNLNQKSFPFYGWTLDFLPSFLEHPDLLNKFSFSLEALKISYVGTALVRRSEEANKNIKSSLTGCCLPIPDTVAGIFWSSCYA